MRAAFVLFNGMTALDFVGVYDPVTRLRSMNLLPDFAWDLCAQMDEVSDDRGLRICASVIGKSLAAYDLLIVPGGFGTRVLSQDSAFLDWLRTAAPVPLKASVCTGALLLGAAGFLAGKRATTHPTAVEVLAAYCEVDYSQRVLDVGPLVTSGGVTAGIDLGLHLVKRLAGQDAARRVATQMDYPYFLHLAGRGSFSKDSGEATRRIGHVAVVVQDYDEAIAFYTNVLGLKLIEDTPLERAKRWVLVGSPDSHGTSLLLAKAVTPEQESRIGNQTGGRVFLFLHTDDFWRDYDRLRSMGVEFIRQPRREAYGTVAVFVDLYGNKWDLIERSTS